MSFKIDADKRSSRMMRQGEIENMEEADTEFRFSPEVARKGRTRYR